MARFCDIVLGQIQHFPVQTHLCGGEPSATARGFIVAKRTHPLYKSITFVCITDQMYFLRENKITEPVKSCFLKCKIARAAGSSSSYGGKISFSCITVSVCVQTVVKLAKKKREYARAWRRVIKPLKTAFQRNSGLVAVRCQRNI